MKPKRAIAAPAVVITSLLSAGMAQPAFAAVGPNATLGAPRPDRDHLGGRDQYHFWQSGASHRTMMGTRGAAGTTSFWRTFGVSAVTPARPL